MKNVFNARYGWIGLLILLVAVNMLASVFHYRFDLTSEKRYTLSAPTRLLLTELDDQVNITVFLSGDMPAGFRKLANSSEELLQEFKEIGGNNIFFQFKKPGEGLNDTLRNIFIDSLQALGLAPLNVIAQNKEGTGQQERYLFPGALISYKNRMAAVDFLQGQSAVNASNALNNAEALLEYKLASSIHKLMLDTIPLIGYLSGNGQSLSYNVYDLINTLKTNYQFRILPIDNVPVIPAVFSAILIVKPTERFSDEQKLKLDQYVMHGGKLVWMIDNLYAEYDSLQRSENEFIAFDRGLNLEDQLFKYGVRINLDLVQDLACDQMPSVIGSVGGKPQIQLLPWPYFPLLNNTNNHPIAKSLDYIVAQFPNSIDTIRADGIRKTILLTSSPLAKTLSSPAKVSWNSVQNQEDINTFNRDRIPIAVLLEGRFSSLFTNRISQATKDSLQQQQQPFLNRADADNRMIVIADGDIAWNAVSENEGPLPMGKNRYSGYQYANKEFILNCIEYLTDNAGLLETRTKDLTLRLLDKKKVQEEKTKWQVISIIMPLLLIIIFGIVFQLMRKRRYQR